MQVAIVSFLFRLYRDFKFMFFVVLIWAVCTLWFALKSHEEFPFLLFGMYSLKEEEQQEYIAYSVVVDKQEVIYGDLGDTRRELVNTTLAHAANLPGNPLADAKFIKWYKRYTAGGKPLEIYRLTCLYSKTGEPLIKKRQILYPYDEF